MDFEKILQELKKSLAELMAIPGLSGHEDRVRRSIAARLTATLGTHVLPQHRMQHVPGKVEGEIFLQLVQRRVVA